MFKKIIKILHCQFQWKILLENLYNFIVLVKVLPRFHIEVAKKLYRGFMSQKLLYLYSGNLVCFQALGLRTRALVCQIYIIYYA